MNRRMELCKKPKTARRLFVVDIENAIGSGKISTAQVVREQQRITADHHITGNDFVVLGISHPANAFPAKAWPKSRLVMKKGHDGADLALKNVLTTENVAKRFSEVIIISGDGTFAQEAMMLRALGTRVVVDAESANIAKDLVKSADTIIFRSRRIQTARLSLAA